MSSSLLKQNPIFLSKQDCRVRISNINKNFACSVVFYENKIVQFNFNKADIETYNFSQNVSCLNSNSKILFLDLNYQVQTIQKQLPLEKQFQKNKFQTHVVIIEIRSQQKLQIKWLQSKKSEISEYFNQCIWLFQNIESKYEIVKQIYYEEGTDKTGNFLLLKDLLSFENRFVKRYQKTKFISKTTKIIDISLILNEIEFQNMIEHENIMRYSKFLIDEEYFYLFFKQKPSKIISQQLKEGIQLSSNRIKGIIEQLLNVLIELQYMQIAHNNIRPSSVFLIQNNNTWKVCLGEFQYAFLLNQNTQPKVHHKNQYYLAPQIISPQLQTEELSALSDVYSLGILFYELLFRQKAIRQKFIKERIQDQTIDFDSTEFKKMPLYCVDLLKQMLEWDCEFRISPSEALSHGFFFKQQAFSPYHSMRSQDLSNVGLQTFPKIQHKKNSMNKKKTSAPVKVEPRRSSKTQCPKKVQFIEKSLEELQQRERSLFYYQKIEFNTSSIEVSQMDDSHQQISLRDVRIMKPAWIVHQMQRKLL